MRVLVSLLILTGIVSAPVLADRWIALWTEDDSWVGMNEDGEVWQLIPGNDPIPAGRFGPGPWVGFSKSWSDHHHYALKSNGEVWVLPALGEGVQATMFRTLPAGREWCNLLTVPDGGYGPYAALACDGEIWILSDPPTYAGTFGAPPVPVFEETWGALKGAYR